MATNKGMLRGTGLRAKREKVDTGGGEKRMGFGREDHVSRGTFMNFYEDLGISTDPYSAETIRADEAQFQQDVKERQGVLSKAQSDYNTSMQNIAKAKSQVEQGYSSIPELNDAVNKSWNEHKQSLSKIRLVDRQDNIQGVYYLPQSVANELSKSDGIWSAEHDGYLNVVSKGDNSELQSILQNGQTSYESKYKMSASKQIASQIGVAYDQLGESSAAVAKAEADAKAYGSQVSSAKDELQTTIDMRQAEWDDLHERYRKRQETMQEIFGGLKVG